VTDNGFVPSTCQQDPAGEFFGAVNAFLQEHFPEGHLLRRLYYAPSACYPNPSYPVIEPYYANTLGGMNVRLAGLYKEGNHFITYTGHSGTQNWGHENFLSVATAAALANGERTPIMLPMTCLEGMYHTPDRDNLSEVLLKSSIGGAVASYAPTGLQVQTGHDFLLKGFYDSIFADGDRILGQAVLQAKLNLLNGPANVQDLHDTFMLLGDPAMHLRIPQIASQNYLPLTLALQ
jgi:hypothetical protein